MAAQTEVTYRCDTCAKTTKAPADKPAPQC